MLIAAFRFEFLLTFFVWAILGVLNLWLFQKSKAQGNLLMLVGAACLAIAAIVMTFSNIPSEFIWTWLPFLGALGIVGGYYLTVKTLVSANIAALKNKVQQATHHKSGGDTPGGTPPAQS